MRPEDLAVLDRELVRMGKRWRGWRIIRWVILATALAMVTVGLYTSISISHLRATDFMLSPLKDAATQPVTRLELEMGMVTTVALICSLAVSVFVIWIGIWFLGYALYNWRQQEINEAVSRVLREKLEEAKQRE